MKVLSTKLRKLISQLNDGEFHSGAALGKALGISRTAVWKYIQQLIAYAVPIEAAQSKGYRLTSPLILLHSKTIQQQITYAGTLLPKKIELLSSISSTNDFLKIPLRGASTPTRICLAEQQTAGRGRFGRQWLSPFGANIYCSLSLALSKDMSKLSGLTLVVALAARAALQTCGVKDQLTVKWPNDILWADAKLGGILTEITAESHGTVLIIIGIGLNVNMPTALAETRIERAWTALDKILNAPQDRNQIVSALINQLLTDLECFDQHGLAPFLRRWQRADYLYDKSVTLNLANTTITGIARGIDAHGHLILQHADGQHVTYSAGEVSLQQKI